MCKCKGEDWIVHGYGSYISAPDSAWFWEGYLCSGQYMVLGGVSVHWLVYGSGRYIGAPDSAQFWEECQCTRQYMVLAGVSLH